MANLNIQVSDKIHFDFKSEITRWGKMAQLKTVIPFLMYFVSQNPEMFKKAFDEWRRKHPHLAA